MSESRPWVKVSHLATGLQAENLESGRDNHALFLVEGGWYTLVALEPLKGFLSALCLVWHHSTDCAPENLLGSTEVEGSTSRLDVASLAQEVEVLELVAVEVSTDVNSF